MNWMENASLSGKGREKRAGRQELPKKHAVAHVGPQHPLVDLLVANALKGPMLDQRGLAAQSVRQGHAGKGSTSPTRLCEGQ